MYIIDNKMFTKYLQLLILQHKPRPPPTFTSFHNIKHMNISYLHMYGRDLSRPLALPCIRDRDKGACPLVFANPEVLAVAAASTGSAAE